MHLRPLQRWRVFAQLCIFAAVVASCGQGSDAAASADVAVHDPYDVWGFEEYQAVVLGDTDDICQRG